MSSVDSRHTEHLPFLRSACYAMKDQLVRLSEKTLQWSATCFTLSARFRVLRTRVNAIQSQLSIYLTNNASEWLESLLHGNLSFSEWRRLSTIEIRKLENSLRRSIASIDSPSRIGTFEDLRPLRGRSMLPGYQRSNLEHEFRQNAEYLLPDIERTLDRLREMMKVAC